MNQADFADEPRLVRKFEATRSLWGDHESGVAADIDYGRGELLSAVLLTLGPGRWFRSSDRWRAVPPNEEHRFWFVVEGKVAMHDPETGDVAVAGPGEGITWRGMRYHFAYNLGDEEAVVIDWFAPSDRIPGVSEDDQAKAKRPLDGPIVGARQDLLAAWPDRRAEAIETAARVGSPLTVPPGSALQTIQGHERPMLVSIFTAGPKLTGGTFELRGGTSSDVEEHAGAEVVFATAGRLNVFLPRTRDWFELNRYDCLYIPPDTPHEYWSYGAERAVGVFCVAPCYR